jgi:type II secretory pathway component GspD/PulD (secretin)
MILNSVTKSRSIKHVLPLLVVALSIAPLADVLRADDKSPDSTGQQLPAVNKSTTRQSTEGAITLQSQLSALTARVKRLEEMLDQHEPSVPEHETKLILITLQHASAKSVVKSLKPHFTSQSKVPTVITYDSRTNTVIARSSDSELIALEAVLMRLDQPTESHASPDEGRFRERSRD